MPIYEYYCASCGHEFEVMQKITDRPIRKCESCGKLKAKRAISKTSFVLRGSGWYVTDYGSANASNRKESSASKDDKKEETSTKTSKDDASVTAPSKKAANA
jgi:putative FmdB family regulatory protein